MRWGSEGDSNSAQRPSASLPHWHSVTASVLGWKDSNLRMRVPKTRDLPLVDTPMVSRTVVLDKSRHVTERFTRNSFSSCSTNRVTAGSRSTSTRLSFSSSQERKQKQVSLVVVRTDERSFYVPKPTSGAPHPTTPLLYYCGAAFLNGVVRTSSPPQRSRRDSNPRSPD